MFWFIALKRFLFKGKRAIRYLNVINMASKCCSYFRILMFSFDSTETK